MTAATRPTTLLCFVVVALAVGCGAQELGEPPRIQIPPADETGVSSDTDTAATTPRSFADISTRAASLKLYEQAFLLAASNLNTRPGWSGKTKTCKPGLTSSKFQAAVLARINYYRAMAGVGPITLNKQYNAMAQAAALLLVANDGGDPATRHDPPPTSTCFSKLALQGSKSGNIFWGTYGTSAIDGYMADYGSGNTWVGHRRWMLYPPTLQMGTGDVLEVTGTSSRAANCLVLFDQPNWAKPRPRTREPYVAWPPAGYVPYTVVSGRWSFSLPGADFSAAKVTVRVGKKRESVTQEAVVDGFGDNTLVWNVAVDIGAPFPQPTRDTTYTVVVQGVKLEGRSRQYTYNVVIYDPVPPALPARRGGRA